MLRLMYTSVHAPSLTGREFEHLLKRASLKNQEHGITGLLLTNGTEFLQCLEGPTLDVIRLYKKILLDPRHTDIRLLVSEPAHQKLFDSWAMMGLCAKAQQAAFDLRLPYTLLDHRLYFPWRTLGLGASNLIYEYARVKSDLERQVQPNFLKMCLKPIELT